MTRRDFLQKLIVAGSAVAAACLALAKTVLPKRFVWAKPLSKYPGRIKAIDDITSQSDWRG